MIAVTLFAFLVMSVCSAAPRVTPLKDNPSFLSNENVYDSTVNLCWLMRSTTGRHNRNEDIWYRTPNEDGYVMNQEGSYSFITPEGIKVKKFYTADKDGFKVLEQPQMASEAKP